MKKLTLLVAAVLLVAALILLTRVSRATSVAIPYCSQVRNDNYSGPCVTTMINGVITGD